MRSKDEYLRSVEFLANHAMKKEIEYLQFGETTRYVPYPKEELNYHIKILKELIEAIPTNFIPSEELVVNKLYWDNQDKVLCYFEALNDYVGMGAKIDLLNPISNEKRKKYCELSDRRFL